MKNSEGRETVEEARYAVWTLPLTDVPAERKRKVYWAKVRWTDVPAESVRENRECERGGQGNAHTASGRGNNNNVSRKLAKRDRKSHTAIMDLLQTQAHSPSTSSERSAPLPLISCHGGGLDHDRASNGKTIFRCDDPL